MNIDFIKVPFSNNPSMQKYDGPLFNPNPDEKYLSEKKLQLKRYGKDLFGQTDQYQSSDLNKKVSHGWMFSFLNIWWVASFESLIFEIPKVMINNQS